MAEMKSPLVEKAVKCPACGVSTNQRFFRQRMFIPDQKESDQHVASYKWLAQDARPVHPPYYFLFFCPHCAYTDLSEDFAKAGDTPAGQRMLAAFRENGARDLLPRFLARHIQYGDIDFESALHLHFLALYIHALPATDLQDAYKLGRLSLRLAWLYREQAGSAPGHAGEAAPREETSDVPEKSPSHTAALIMDAIKAMEASQKETARHWEALQSLLRTRIREIVEASELPSADQYPICCAALEESVRKQQTELDRLRRVCERDLMGMFVNSTPRIPRRNGEPGNQRAQTGGSSCTPSSHEVFLEKLKVMWPDVPLTERQALETAIGYFRRALSADPRFDSPENRVKGAMLLADLLIRCDDYTGALEAVRGVYDPAMQARKELQEGLRKNGLGEPEQRRMQGRMKRVTETLEQAGEMRQQILELMVTHEMPEIKQAIAQARSRKLNLEEALAAQGISPEVILELKKPGGLLSARAKK